MNVYVVELVIPMVNAILMVNANLSEIVKENANESMSESVILVKPEHTNGQMVKDYVNVIEYVQVMLLQYLDVIQHLVILLILFVHVLYVIVLVANVNVLY